MDTIGAYVRSERLKRRISLRQLAKRIGISPTYLSHIEIDHVPPPAPDKLERIATELDLDFDDLLRRAGRWGERAAEVLGSRSELRDLFHLAFAMDSRDVRDLVEEIERRQAVPREVGGLF
jgi:transcriptional regulator with XRE-family HTH domain